MIPVILQWGSAILSLAKNLSDDPEIANAKSVLDTANTAYNVLNTSSVSMSAGRFMISPMVLIEESLLHQDYMTDLMTIVNMRDTRDALSHINSQSTIGGVTVGKFVDSINPNRSAGFMCHSAMEAMYPPSKSIANLDKDKKDDKDEPPKLNGIDSKSYREELDSYRPLSVGRTVDAVVTYNGQPTKIPLTFRQIPIPCPTENMKLIFASVKSGQGFFARLKDWDAGDVTGPEVLTGVDDIKREFRIRNNDLTGYYEEANKRANRNRVESLRTGDISVNTLANTIILSKETATQIEYDIGVRFGSSGMSKIRKAVKANTIIIVNADRGVFTFYSMSSNLAETYTINGIKTKAKKEGSADTLDSLIKLLRA